MLFIPQSNLLFRYALKTLKMKFYFLQLHVHISILALTLLLTSSNYIKTIKLNTVIALFLFKTLPITQLSSRHDILTILMFTGIFEEVFKKTQPSVHRTRICLPFKIFYAALDETHSHGDSR